MYIQLVGLRPRVCYSLINFKGGGGGEQAHPPQYANGMRVCLYLFTLFLFCII